MTGTGQLTMDNGQLTIDNEKSKAKTRYGDPSTLVGMTGTGQLTMDN